MADEKGTGNIIIDVLLRAGLQLSEKDAKALEKRLRDAGAAMSKGGEAAMKDLQVQAAHLDKLLGNFEKRRALLERTARGDDKGKPLGIRQRQKLSAGFDEARTIDQQIGKLLGTMHRLAEGNEDRFFNETKSLQTARRQITALANAASKNIDGVTLELQKNLRKERELRKVETTKARREALSKNNELRSTELRKGKQVFKEGQKSGFVGITDKRDAQEALKYAKAQQKYLKETADLMAKGSNPKGAPAQSAQRRALDMAGTVATLDQRVKDLGDNDAIKRRDEASARRIAKAEADYALNRSLRGSQQRGGAQALLEAGGIFAGNASRFQSPEKIAKAMKFLNGELADSKALFKTLRTELGETDPRVLRLSNSLTRMNSLVADMGDRDTLLKNNKLSKAQQDKANEQRIRDEAVVQKRLGEMETQRRTGKATPTAQDLINEGLTKGQEKRAQTAIDARIKAASVEDAQRIKDEAKLQRHLGEMERQRVTGTATPTAQDLIDTGLSKGRESQAAAAFAAQRKAAEDESNRKLKANAKIGKADRDSASFRATNPAAYKLFTDAAADPASLTSVKEANRALAVGSKELGTMRTKQEALISATQQNTNEYRQLTAEIERAQRAMASLNDRRIVLEGEARSSAAGGGSIPSNRSSIYTGGRDAYESNVGRVGGLEGLTGNDRDQAKSYNKAKLAEAKQAFDALNRSGAATQQQLRAAGDEVLRFEDSLRRLSNGAGNASGKMAYLTNVFKMFVKYAVAYQALYMIAEAFIAIGRAVVNLQTDLLDIQAITGSTTSDMEKLGSVVQSVAQNSKFSLDELTKATKTLAQAGVPLADLNKTLQATANFAAATGTSLETASDIVSTMRSVFKELNDDVIANQLAKAINISKLTGEGLRTILSLGAQTAKDFNISSEQFLGAVASLRNAGLKDSTAATGLRQSMLEIFTPDNTLVQALLTRYKEIGETISSEAVRQRFFSFTQSENPLLAAMTELKRLGFGDEGAMGLTRAFDVRSSNAIRAMIDNLQELSQFEGEITFGRAAAEGARTTVDGLNASWTRLISTINSYAYNRSDGILGFLTEAINGLDTAIQRWEKWENLKNASFGLSDAQKEERKKAGLDPEGGPDNRTFAQKLFDSGVDAVTFKGAQDDFMRLRDIVDPQGAELRNIQKNITGTNRSINDSERERESYVLESNQLDVKKARAGENPGTGAEQIVKAVAVADSYKQMVTTAFGPEMAAKEAEMRQLLNSYVNLPQSQRAVREQDLRQQFPTLDTLKPEEFDRALTDMDSAGKQMKGKLNAMVIGLNKALVDASATFTQMAGNPAQNANQFKAQTMLSLFKYNDALQKILEGTTTLTAEEQIKVVEAFGQQTSDAIRTKGGELSERALITQQVLVLSDRAKLLNRTATIDGGRVELQAEVSRVISAQKDSATATLEYLQTLRSVMLEVAKTMGGNGSYQFTEAITQVEQAIKAAQPKVLEETKERVSQFNEQLIPTLKDPNYLKTVNNLPETDPTKAPLLAMIANPPPVADAAGNSKRFQLLEKSVTGYKTREKVQADLEVKVSKETKERLALENLRGEARTAAAEAASGNHFEDARRNKQIEAGASIQILSTQIKRANEEMRLNVERGDPDFTGKNRALLEQRGQLENELMLVQRDLGKTVADLNQEEAKVNNKRDTTAAKGEQSRLTEALSAVGADTPASVVKNLITAYDENQAQLFALLEVRKQLEGDMSDEARAELEETQRKLLKYKDQNAYLDLLGRQETEIRARNNRELDKPLSTGDTTEDARLNQLGIAPGSRTDRSYFLANKAQLLSDNVTSTQKQLQDNEQAKANAEKFLKDNPNPDAEGYTQQVKNLTEANNNISSLNAELDGYRVRIGEIRNELNNVRQTLPGALDQAFDLDTIILGLEQSESGVEKLADKIHTALIAGIEGVGDAFADALLEGKDFFDSLNDLFIDTGKQILRDVIKTYTTESITGFLRGFSPKAQQDAGTANPAPNPLGGGLFGMGASLVKKGYNWLTGAPPEQKPSGTGKGYELGSPLPGDIPMDEAPAGGVLVASQNLLAQPGNNTVLADAAAGEAKGFFATLTEGFGSVWDSLSEGLGGALSSIGSLFTGGEKGGGGGVLGLLTAMIPGMKMGGIIKAASGGIIVGRGTGTSDSVPGLIRAKNGKLHPLMTSNGESILNARATSVLGADTIHAMNSGNFLRADTSGTSRDSARMMRSMQAGSFNSSQSPFAKGPTKQYNTTQVAVTPAQMRMRMGDWLEQHVIEELGSR